MKRLISSVLLIIVTVSLAGAQDASTVEQKINDLRVQLQGMMDKQTELQGRLARLEEDLKPENVQRSVAGIGTTDAEALRGQRQQSLEREKANVAEQLRSLDTSRTRLEASIASAEAEAVRLRANVLGASNAPQPVSGASNAPQPVIITNTSATLPVQNKQSARQKKRLRSRRTRHRAH